MCGHGGAARGAAGEGTAKIFLVEGLPIGGVGWGKRPDPLARAKNNSPTSPYEGIASQGHVELVVDGLLQVWGQMKQTLVCDVGLLGAKKWSCGWFMGLGGG